MKKTVESMGFTLGMLALATALSFGFFTVVPERTANISLIYILALIIIARRTDGYFYGIFSSIVCVIFVNYFFSYPYFKLNFTLSGYPVTFIGMLTISIITSTMTTHLKHQSQILADHEKRLAEAEKEKMRANLLRAISHDLRTPLTGIIGTTSSILENPKEYTEQEKIQMVQHVYDDSHWLLNMVENLLSVTRIQNDINKVKKQPEFVEEVISEAVVRLRKRIPDIKINVHIPDDVIMLSMDAILIEQVLMNLMENAYEHSQSVEPIDLVVIIENSNVLFKIIDHGIGFDSERVNAMFDGKITDNTSNTDGYRGMGIGLSICKTIVLAHDGTITANNLEQGAEFAFTLPMTEADLRL